MKPEGINWRVLMSEEPAPPDVALWQRAARLQEPFRRFATQSTWRWWTANTLTNAPTDLIFLLETLNRVRARVRLPHGGEDRRRDWLGELRAALKLGTRDIEEVLYERLRG